MGTEDVTELLKQLVLKRGWWGYYYGGRDSPRLIAYTYVWHLDGVADVLILRGEDRASAYRTYWEPNANIFTPDLVYWYYESNAKQSIRAILGLPEPSEPGAPFQMCEPPSSCRVDDEDRPVVIRPTRSTL